MTDVTIIATGTEFVNKGLRRTQPVIEDMINNANKSIHILNYLIWSRCGGTLGHAGRHTRKGKTRHNRSKRFV